MADRDDVVAHPHVVRVARAAAGRSLPARDGSTRSTARSVDGSRAEHAAGNRRPPSRRSARSRCSTSPTTWAFVTIVPSLVDRRSRCPSRRPPGRRPRRRRRRRRRVRRPWRARWRRPRPRAARPRPGVRCRDPVRSPSATPPATSSAPASAPATAARTGPRAERRGGRGRLRRRGARPGRPRPARRRGPLVRRPRGRSAGPEPRVVGHLAVSSHGSLPAPASDSPAALSRSTRPPAAKPAVISRFSCRVAICEPSRS